MFQAISKIVRSGNGEKEGAWSDTYKSILKLKVSRSDEISVIIFGRNIRMNVDIKSKILEANWRSAQVSGRSCLRSADGTTGLW